jgi:1-acyl-sn-glycerol-3-phosphate acyltransferase
MKYTINKKRNKMVFFFSKTIFWPLIKIFIKEIKGIENLPEKKFILASNHSSLIDGPILILLTAKYRNKKLRLLSTKKFFKGSIWNILFNHYGAIRVNGSIKKAIKETKKGDCIGILPEGKRSKTGKISNVKNTGLGILALKTKMPIVPIALKTYNFWNKHQKIPNFKKNIKINIGKPLYFKELKEKKITKKNAEYIVKKTMNQIKKLKKNE